MTRRSRGGLLAVLVLAAAAAQAQPGPCALSGWMDDDGRLWLHHDLEANCGTCDFEHEVAFGPGAIDVRESALLEAWAWCDCPFATDVVIAGLAPGDYLVHWSWAQVDVTGMGPDPEWFDCAFTVTVPGGGGRSEPSLVGTQASGCSLNVSAVPEDDPPSAAAWGAIKSLYR